MLMIDFVMGMLTLDLSSRSKEHHHGATTVKLLLTMTSWDGPYTASASSPLVYKILVFHIL